MKLHRIYALMLRYFYLTRHSFDRATDMLYWPILDLLLWGLTSAYFQSYISETDTVIFTIIAGIIFWFVVVRGQYEMSVNILEELWNRNMVNLFVSPLKFSEMIAASAIISVAKAAIGFSFAAFLAKLLFDVNLIYFGIYLFPLTLVLLMTGWVIGLFVAGTILRFGTKLQALAWTLVWVISPFSAIYYPLSILPGWGQTIAKFIPVSYVFENSRMFIMSGRVDIYELSMTILLSVIYLICALWYAHRSFAKSLEKGLVKLY
ncbi:MAG: ABC transporter permease [Candidatus Sungbacteria bacterium]|nr:ABC transporter permease [Candidatus Sungbacteria bacterium]